MAAGRKDFDVVVVGAGSAGSAAAVWLSRVGLSVGLTDARPFDASGARWSNTIVPWLFDRAQIARPTPPERVSIEYPMTFVNDSFDWRMSIGTNPAWKVRMDLLGERLRREAFERGTQGMDRATLSDPVFSSEGRLRSLRIRYARTDGGFGEEIWRASLFVDASGLAKALTAFVPDLRQIAPKVERSDLCHAHNEECAILDPAGARAFLERYGERPGGCVAWIGQEGGFSTLCVHVMPDLGSVDLLGGAVADGLHRTGPALLKAFKAQNPWVGASHASGGALIPIRRPYDRLGIEGCVLIGDAACQTFPAHGSGVGTQLVAARLLAESIRESGDPGGIEAVWGYARAFQREFGGGHAAYDCLRQGVQECPYGGVEEMVRLGLINPAGTRASLDHRFFEATPKDLLRMARAFPGNLPLALYMGRVMSRALALAGLYRAYPVEPDPRAFRNWERLVSRLTRKPADTGPALSFSSA